MTLDEYIQLCLTAEKHYLGANGCGDCPGLNLCQTFFTQAPCGVPRELRIMGVELP